MKLKGPGKIFRSPHTVTACPPKVYRMLVAPVK